MGLGKSRKRESSRVQPHLCFVVALTDDPHKMKRTLTKDGMNAFSFPLSMLCQRVKVHHVSTFLVIRRDCYVEDVLRGGGLWRGLWRDRTECGRGRESESRTEVEGSEGGGGRK